jgi:pilus assembly protein CpaC
MTLFGGLENADLEMFIQALTENQYLRLLAEPNLVALSGEEASFLAGGEIPIPVPQASGAGGGTTITIEYQPYGIQLKFRPTVLGDGTIRLYVGPEVSELDYSNAVTLPGSSPIPALLTRRAESTVELKSGQTFAIAGLLNQSTNSRNSMVPLLGSVPVLGPLFRSIRYQSEETELVVMATATLVEPLSIVNTPPVPGVLHAPPSDWDFYVEGRLEGKQPPKISPSDAAYLKKLGFDTLKGPGSWETYDQGTAKSEATQRPVQARPVPVSEVATPAPAAAN